MKSKGAYVTTLAVLIIVVDQAIKLWVKTHMYLGEAIRVTDWFAIRFTENDGMAFGWEVLNKYFLTSFRLCIVPFIIYYTAKLVRNNASWGLLTCMALVLAGAVGNIVDCVFYGLIFNNPPAPMVADFVSFGHGYSSVLLGRVVDMFSFSFFSPIFNFADASISCGVAMLVLFYRERLNT